MWYAIEAGKQMAAEALETMGQTIEQEIAALWGVVTRQQAELDALRNRLRGPRASAANSSGAAAATCTPNNLAADRLGGDSALGRRTVRRALLKTASASAAAVVGAGLLAARDNLTGATEHAEAANGANLIIGQTNTGSSTTQLAPDPPSGPDILLAIDNQASTTTSVDAAAVYAVGPNVTATGTLGGNGVHAVCNGTAAYAVYGETDSGYGVVGSSSSGIDLYAYGAGRLQQRLQAAVGAPTGGTFTIGEQVRDANGDLYLCVADGTPGAWKKVLASPAGVVGGAVYLLSSPIRLLDTRPGAIAAITPGRPLDGGEVYPLQVTGESLSAVRVPSGALGVIGNITVVFPSGPGDLTVYPAGTARPLTSNINYVGGQVLGNSLTVGLSSDGKVNIYCDVSSTHVVLDVAGYVA